MTGKMDIWKPIKLTVGIIEMRKPTFPRKIKTISSKKKKKVKQKAAS